MYKEINNYENPEKFTRQPSLIIILAYPFSKDTLTLALTLRKCQASNVKRQNTIFRSKKYIQKTA